MNQSPLHSDPLPDPLRRPRSSPVLAGLRFLHRGYKLFLSGSLGNCCRFHPTCSDYALEAVGSHGLLRGAWLALWRILRCQPFAAGGFDPVPPAAPDRPVRPTPPARSHFRM